MVIVRGVLEGKLAKRARLMGERGYTALLVDPTEIRDHIRKPAMEGFTLEAAMAELGTFHAVVRALVDHDKLRTFRASHPVNNQSPRLVSRSELDSFKKKYVSLAELAERERKHPRAVRAALEQVGVVPTPELDKAIYGIVFYRREDLSP